MAKKITKKETEKNTVKTPKEEIFTGSLFQNQTEQKSEIPLEITNSEKVEIVEEISKSYNDEKSTKFADDSIFSLADNLYIEVHKSNLLQYFSAGCIFPTKYSSQKAFSDPQSINENGLLISNGFLSNDKDHILIQIDAFGIEKTLLSVNILSTLSCSSIL